MLNGIMDRNRTKNAQFSVRISEELYEQLKIYAREDDRSLASYVMRVLQQHADAKLAEKREAVE